MRPKKKKIKIEKTIFLLVTLGPAFVFYFLFTILPQFASAAISLTRWNGITEPVFIGFKNFQDMLHDRYILLGLRNSFLLMCVNVPITLTLAILLAFILTNTKFKENKFYKALYYFPNIMPVVIVALLWSFVYDGNMGLLNGILGLFTDKFDGYYWLADKSKAMFCLMVPMIWGGVGSNMIIYINAITAIPNSLYEFATLEGATLMQKLWYVTIPLIRETLITTATFAILGAFNGFEMIMLMTGGGPSGSTYTLAMYMYNLAFGESSGLASAFGKLYGYGSALGIILMIILMTIRAVMARLTKADSVQY